MKKTDTITLRVSEEFKEDLKTRLGKTSMSDYIIELINKDTKGNASYGELNHESPLLDLIDKYHPTAKKHFKDWIDQNQYDQSHLIFTIIDEFLAKIESPYLMPRTSPDTRNK